MVKRYFTNPIFLSVIFLYIIFYSNLFSISFQKSYDSVFYKDDIIEISGKLLSSPVKSSSGKNYSANFELSSVKNLKNSKASAIGKSTILIPSILVEAHFPGKLYTLINKKNAFLYEAGGNYTFRGRFFGDFFIVENCLENTWEKNIFGKIDYFRALCRLQFKRLMHSWNGAGGLLLSLLSGQREYTEFSVSESFKNSGLSHILALSGMHLSMFSAIAIFFGERINRKKITFIIRIIALIIFVWFAGFSPSLLRAFICSILLIFASMASVEKPDMIIILCFSFIFQSIISPSDIKNYGFILSYGALFGILLTNNFFLRIYSFFSPKIIASSLSSSTGAQIFTAPISLKLFGTFSPIGIIATTVISPLISIFIYSGLFFIIISLIFPILSSYSGILLNFEYTIIKYLVGFFSLAPRISFESP